MTYESRYPETPAGQVPVEPNSSGLITYLIDRGFIGETDIRRYTMQKEYEVLMSGKAANKTHAVSIISHRFNISERTVWNLLKPMWK